MQRIEVSKISNGADETVEAGDNASPAASGSGPAPYETPRLVRVGSLRNLLGKTGFVADKQFPFELRE